MELAEADLHRLLELATGVLRVHLLGSLPHRDLVLRAAGDLLLQTLYAKRSQLLIQVQCFTVDMGVLGWMIGHTNLSKMQLFNFCSGRRQLKKVWLLFSRQST